MSRGTESVGRQVVMPANSPVGSRNDGRSLLALSGSSVADRFCAWQGQAARRTVFSVFALEDGDAIDLPLDGGGVVLGVRRDAVGRRQVAWSAATPAGPLPPAVRSALAALARQASAEAHLHLLTTGEAAREALVTALGFPRLATLGSEAGPLAARRPAPSLRRADLLQSA